MALVEAFVLGPEQVDTLEYILRVEEELRRIGIMCFYRPEKDAPPVREPDGWRLCVSDDVHLPKIRDVLDEWHLELKTPELAC